MSAVETAANRDVEILALQSQLFSYCGSVQVSRAAARPILARINKLRQASGWKPLTLKGRTFLV